MPFAKIEGRDLHYTEHNPSSDQASALSIIFVHGLGSTQNYFGPILPYLTKYHCVTFDNYAAGRSKYYPDLYPETSIEGIATDVLGFMDHLKIQRAIVLGYSMGGMVPTTIAASKAGKERIISGICIGPVHPTAAVAEVFQKRVATVREGGIETMANTIPTAATGPATTPLQKSFIREMVISQDPEGYCANCRAIESAKPPNYEAVECPIFIISGEVDKSTPVSGCQHIHDSLVNVKDKKIEIVKDMGHWYCVEGPEKIGTMVAEWCQKFA